MILFQNPVRLSDSHKCGEGLRFFNFLIKRRHIEGSIRYDALPNKYLMHHHIQVVLLFALLHLNL